MVCSEAHFSVHCGYPGLGWGQSFDEFEETKEPVPRSSGGGSLVAATFIKYVAIVIVALIIAYVVLRILGVVQSSF